MKRFSADDSAETRVKVGHRQASYKAKGRLTPALCLFGKRLAEPVLLRALPRPVARAQYPALIFASGLAILLAGCASPAPSNESPGISAGALKTSAGTTTLSAEPSIPLFSAAPPGALIPPGWEHWILHPRKARTDYGLRLDNGVPVLSARAVAAASGLLTRTDIDPHQAPTLEWAWKTDAVIEEADNSIAALEDSPLRVVLAFDGDKSSLPIRDQLFFERMKLFTGVDMPYATLMYIWGNKHPVEAVVPNPHSPRIQKIVVSHGRDGVKRWHRLRRNIVADYQRAFGAKPGRLVGVAVLTDTDNTKGEVSASYGDIRLLKRP